MVVTEYSISLNANISHLISILSYFRRIQFLTPLFTIQSLSLFRTKWISITFPSIFLSDLFHYYYPVTKYLTLPVPLRSCGQNFEWAPQLWNMYCKCRPFPPPCFCTLIISKCTYYDDFFNVIFSNFPSYPFKAK